MKAEERRAISRLVDAFGADVAVSMVDVPELSKVRRIIGRLTAEERIEGCTACDLHETRGGCQVTPLTPFWSPAAWPRQGRVAVIADAPTIEEHRAGQLGLGPIYRMMRQTLREGGIEPDMVTYLAAVLCTPMVSDRRGTRRTPPNETQVAVCSANVVHALVAADVTYVLLLGAHALRVWRPDLRRQERRHLAGRHRHGARGGRSRPGHRAAPDARALCREHAHQGARAPVARALGCGV